MFRKAKDPVDKPASQTDELLDAAEALVDAAISLRARMHRFQDAVTSALPTAEFSKLLPELELNANSQRIVNLAIDRTRAAIRAIVDDPFRCPGCARVVKDENQRCASCLAGAVSA